MKIPNIHVDENGIPPKGFIQADKLRKRQFTQSVNLLSGDSGPKPGNAAVTSSQFLTKVMLMVGLPVLLALTAGITFLFSENQHLAAEIEEAQIGQVQAELARVKQSAVEMDEQLSKESIALQTQIVALQNKVEQEKRQVAVNAELSLVAALSGLKSQLNTDTSPVVIRQEKAQNQQELDDQLLSRSDSLSGNVVGTVDPEIARLRDRTARMINAQPSPAQPSL